MEIISTEHSQHRCGSSLCLFFWRASSWRIEQTFLEVPNLHYPSTGAGGWSPLVQRGANYVTLCALSVRVWHNELFFRIGKASFLKITASPTFASKMMSVMKQIKDAERKLSVDEFREVYDLSKSLVIEMYGKQAGFNSLASVRTYIWCQKQDVRRLPPSGDIFESCIWRVIFATWIILLSVQDWPSIPDSLLHGWKMAEWGVDAVISSCKEASNLEAYCRCKSGRCRKDCSYSKMKGCCTLCSCCGTRRACRESDLAPSEFSEEENEQYFWMFYLIPFVFNCNRSLISYYYPILRAGRVRQLQCANWIHLWSRILSCSK